MTTYTYTLTLDDSEAITLHDALSMYANANERNSDRARKLIERIHADTAQASGNNFNDTLVQREPIIKIKTDLFEDQ